MNKLSKSIVEFAGKNTTAYEMFADYYKRYSAEVLKKNIGTYSTTNGEGQMISLSDMESQMNTALMAEVERVAGVKMPENMTYQMWASNPNFKWATFAVITMMIETILPATIVDSIGLYTDMRFIDWGDVPLFDIPNRALPIVSKSGNAQRQALIQKLYRGNQTVDVANHNITMSVDMYAVLSGRQSLAEFARRAVIAIEADMTQEAYAAVKAGLTAVSVPEQLHVEGAFDMETLIKMCQTVGAYNYGMKPIIVATTLGAMKILPDSADGYRLNTDAAAPAIGLTRTAYGYDLMILDQVAVPNYTNYGLVLDDNLIMVMSPAADKLLRGITEGATLTNSNDYYDNADLTSNFTINKRYGFGYLSGSVAGAYELTA